jgi:hypothetical protein
MTVIINTTLGSVLYSQSGKQLEGGLVEECPSLFECGEVPSLV